MMFRNSLSGIFCLWLLSMGTGFGATPEWRWSNPLPHGNHINDMLLLNGSLIQVTEGGRLYSSADMDSWSLKQTQTTNSLRAITLFNDQIVISGQNGTILHGNSVENLQLIQLPTTDWLEGVAASPSTVVAVGDNGAIYTSTDAITWKKQSGFSTWLRSVTCSNGRFYAVGEGGVILTSTNGLNWTSVTSGTTQDLNKVAFAKDRFYAVGANGTVIGLNSRGSWVAESLGTTNTLYGIAGNTNTVLVVGDSEVQMKTDPSSAWASQITATTTFPAPPWTYYSTVWDGQSFLIGGRTGFFLQGYRTNTAMAVDWSTRVDSPRNWLWNVTKTPNFYAAVGHHGTILTSPDGIDWQQEVVPAASTNTILLGICGNSNMVVVCGYNGTILYSTNRYSTTLLTNTDGTITTNKFSLLGLVWDQAPRVPVTNDLQGVALLSQRFIVTGNKGAILTSDDASTWTARSSGKSTYLSSVAASPTLAVAVGEAGVILNSLDGVSWTPRTSGVTNWIYQVRYFQNRFTATGQGGLILTSADGKLWNRATTPTTEWINDVTVVGTNYFAVGDAGLVLQSPNGTTWSRIPVPTFKPLFGAASSNGQLVMVGVEGAVLRAQIDPRSTPVNFLSFSRTNGRNAFYFGGETDQRFQVERSTDLKGWQPGPALEITDGSGTLLYLDSTNAIPKESFRTRLITQ